MSDQVVRATPDTPMDLGQLRPGDMVIVRGSARTSHDGTVFDATTRTDDTGTRPGGLYAIDGSGLRVVEQHVDTHEIKLVATGEHAQACSSIGLAGPCLVPRTKELALERLMTTTEFASTLSGSVEVVVPTPPPPPIVTPAQTHGAALVGVAALVVVGAIAAWRWRVGKRATPIGQVHAAAAEARRRTTGDPTLASIRSEIEGLVARADGLERARMACARRLAKIDRREIARRRAAWEAAGTTAPGAQHTAGWIAQEEAEAERLVRDHAAAIAALEQIAAALRVVALQSREERGVRVADAARVALDGLAHELTLREDALAEVERDAARETTSTPR